MDERQARSGELRGNTMGDFVFGVRVAGDRTVHRYRRRVRPLAVERAGWR